MRKRKGLLLGLVMCAPLGANESVVYDTEDSALSEGRLVYVMRFEGDSVGTSVFETRRDGDGWVFTETTVIERFDVSAVNQARVDSELRPLDFSASGRMFGSEVEIVVSFEDGRARGRSLFPREGGSSTLSLDSQIPEGTLERTSTFFIAASFDYAAAEAIEFPWYDTYSGSIQEITAEAVDVERTTVPAGSFDTWRVELRGGTPSQVLWVSRSPQRIVRMSVVGQPWTYELVRVEDLASQSAGSTK